MGFSERESFRLRLIGKERLLGSTSILQTCFKKPSSHQFYAYVGTHRISDLSSCHERIRTCNSNKGGVLCLGCFADTISCCIANAPRGSELQ
ncbi:hypothetical protein MTO96_045754 [Rhipicephalus appendiculatus]